MPDARDENAQPKLDRVLSRRQTLRWVGSTLVVAPLANTWGCGSDSGTRDAGHPVTGRDAGNPDGGGNRMDARSGPVSNGSSDAGADPDASGAMDAGGPNAGDAGDTVHQDGGPRTVDGWASGGTDAMTGGYPNPFPPRPDNGCTPTCSMTLGPCHDDQAPQREDISEGKPGLPMRFGLRILDTACQPVTDANVDIWHCDVMGLYSSETTDVAAFCTGNDAAALAARFFRGHRMTNSKGIAWFNTVFPGWYAGRAIHIHVTIRRSSRQGDEYLTTQIAFPTDLNNEICSSHQDYVSRGLPDTTNATDSVFPAGSVGQYVVETRRMPDGVLLAWKTLMIRSSLSESLCAAGGL